MTSELIVLLGDKAIGVVRRDKRGRLKFTYEEEWRTARGAYPLSLSMPLAASEHGHAAIEAFLWGLLPDNEFVLGKWAQKFQVSARNAFALISNVGEDCAGAVQFVRPDRLETVLENRSGAIEWIDEAGIASRLRDLRVDNSAWRRPADTGQFSLAGAQPKTALYFMDDRWGVPSGRTPTTHILKPPTGEFDGYAENEHFCLMLARELGLPTASSSIQRFGSELAIVLERYDRRTVDGQIIRVHQEDICQALSVLPTRKYQNEGGPGVPQIYELLHAVSGAPREDVETFINAVIFSWLIGGTDAHAKNYSILIGAGGRARLAPLYDLASALPYDGLQFQKLKLAMKVGDEYKLQDIGVKQWKDLAGQIKTPEDKVIQQAASMVDNMPDACATVREILARQQLTHPVIDKTSAAISARAEQMKSIF